MGLTSWKKWKEGDSHLINRVQWDEREVKSILERVFGEDWFAQGSANKDFEKKISSYTEIPYVYSTIKSK